MKQVKTSKRDFALFQKICQHYLDEFGVRDWCIAFEHTADGGDNAWCKPKFDAKLVTIGLDTKVDADLKSNIKDLALHESLEMVMMPIHELLMDAGVDDAVTLKAVHGIIHQWMSFMKRHGL